MINSINLKNFKCFKDDRVEFTNANLLLGTNSGGKSSLIQAILISKMGLDNILKKGRNSVDLISNDFNLDLHSFEEILYKEAYEDAFSITISYDEHNVKLDFSQTDDSNVIGVDADVNIEGLIDSLIYLSSDRGTSRLQKRGDHSNIVLGANNEYLSYIIEKAQKNLVKIYSERNYWNDQNTKLLDLQINNWLNYILPGNRVTAKHNASDSYLSLLFGEKANLHQMNVGYGVSFVLPIIIAGLIVPKNSVLVIENPELHLHPKAQSNIATFLAVVAASGVQVIIETHSEHIVNGFRKSILTDENPFKKRNLAINFLSVEEKCCIQQIELNDKVEIKSWPKGFLDQEEEDLYEIRKLRLKI